MVCIIRVSVDFSDLVRHPPHFRTLAVKKRLVSLYRDVIVLSSGESELRALSEGSWLDLNEERSRGKHSNHA